MRRIVFAGNSPKAVLFLSRIARIAFAAAFCLACALALCACSGQSSDDPEIASVNDALRIAGSSYSGNAQADEDAASTQEGDAAAESEDAASSDDANVQTTKSASGTVIAFDKERCIVALQLDADSRGGVLADVVYLSCDASVMDQLQVGDEAMFTFQASTAGTSGSDPLTPGSFAVWKKLV